LDAAYLLVAGVLGVLYGHALLVGYGWVGLYLAASAFVIARWCLLRVYGCRPARGGLSRRLLPAAPTPPRDGC
jgi:hypothetical protein